MVTLEMEDWDGLVLEMEVLMLLSERQDGLYIARMKLKPPEGFAGPAPP